MGNSRTALLALAVIAIVVGETIRVNANPTNPPPLHAPLTVEEAIRVLDSLPPIKRNQQMTPAPNNPTATLIRQTPNLEVYRANDMSYFWIERRPDGLWYDHNELI